MKAASAIDYREVARRRLPRFLFDYLDGGSYAEVTLGRNIADLEAVALRQLVLRDVSRIDTSTTLFGRKQALPVALAPVGLAGMYARRGEVQGARAAEAAGIPFTLSTMAACSLSEVASAVRDPIWFQLYVTRDRGFMRDLIAQAAERKCSALVFTVDLPVAGSRYRDHHSGMINKSAMVGRMRRAWQAAMRPHWAWDVGVHGRPHSLGNLTPVLGGKNGIDDYFGWLRDNFDASINWRDLDFIRSEWKGPLIVKGILDPQDAREAVKGGVDGIVVSNHGGRQLDGVLSGARALPPIADAVGDDTTVLVDGGIRSGLDVVRMLALGAKGVLIGRAWVYALAGGGQEGVAHVLQLIEAEMRVAMSLTGATSIDKIDRSILAGV